MGFIEGNSHPGGGGFIEASSHPKGVWVLLR